MKKHAILLTLLITILTLLPSCALATKPDTTPRPASVPTSTATINALKRVTPSVISEVQPTNTSLPPTDEATSPPESPTLPILATVTTSSEPIEPFTRGRIIFLWVPEEMPAPEDMGPDPFISANLYLAQPGSTPDDWIVETVVEDIHVGPIIPSHDLTKVAIFTKDRGQYEAFDGEEKIKIFDLVDYSFITLEGTGDVNISKLGWTQDSQALIYASFTNLMLAKLDGTPPVSLTNNPTQLIEGESTSMFRTIVQSPNGKLLALNETLGVVTSTGGVRNHALQTTLYSLDQQTMTTVPAAANTIPYSTVDFTWDPENEWITIKKNDGRSGLDLVNTQTLELIQLVTESPAGIRVSPVTWSSTGQWLAFHNDLGLQLWNRVTETLQQVNNERLFIGSPIWSPTDERLVVGFIGPEDFGWFFFNPTKNTSYELLIDMSLQGTPIWSPDGQWLLFSASQKQEPVQSGLYIIHVESGQLHLMLDTTNMYEPGTVYWLPN